MRYAKSLILFSAVVLFGFSMVPFVFDFVEFLREQTLAFWMAVYFLAIQTAIAKGVFMNSRDSILADMGESLAKVAKSLERVSRSLSAIEATMTATLPATTVEFFQIINGRQVKVVRMFMKIDQVADLAVAFKDKLGNAAKVDGAPAWALTDESLGKLEVAADGMSAALSLLGIGAFKVQVKADADLGEGVKEIVGELAVEVSALDAEFVEISATVRA